QRFPAASQGAAPVPAAQPCSRVRPRGAILRTRRSRWTAALGRILLNHPTPFLHPCRGEEGGGVRPERTTMKTIAGNAGGLAAVIAIVGTMTAGPATAQLHIAAEARVTLLARAYNAAGQQLFGQLAASPGNIVFSPYSVGTAMSMLI